MVRGVNVASFKIGRGVALLVGAEHFSVGTGASQHVGKQDERQKYDFHVFFNRKWFIMESSLN